MLVLDFKKRITVEEALAHPYLADFHYEEGNIFKGLFNKKILNKTDEPVR